MVFYWDIFKFKQLFPYKNSKENSNTSLNTALYGSLCEVVTVFFNSLPIFIEIYGQNSFIFKLCVISILKIWIFNEAYRSELALLRSLPKNIEGNCFILEKKLFSALELFEFIKNNEFYISSKIHLYILNLNRLYY